MLNSTEHEIFPANKYENVNNYCHLNIYLQDKCHAHYEFHIEKVL